MKCPYRIHKTENPDPMNKLAIHTKESFEDCYESECAYWVEGCCGKAKADMSTDKKDE